MSSSGIKSALTFLGKATTSTVVPTAGSRSALSTLIESNPEDIAAMPSIKPLSDGLFNWNKPRSTKILMSAMSKALSTPGKYQHAVELTSFISALSPLLEADRLAKLYSVLDEVDTVFAPLKYTLQANARLTRLLLPYSEERREKIVRSMWVEIHTGRWWDLSAGQGVGEYNYQQDITDKALLESFLEENLNYTTELKTQLSKIKPHDKIVEMLEDYKQRFLRGEIINPDTGVLASHIPWLSLNLRPENPLLSLLDMHHRVCEDLEYKIPKKPESFSKMFPDIKLYGTKGFPLVSSPIAVMNMPLSQNLKMSFIRSATELHANAQYMGNCTYSYKDSMEKATYALYKITDKEGHTYNAAMSLYGNKWNVGEVAARQNRRASDEARQAFAAFVRAIPAFTPMEIAHDESKKKTEEYILHQNFTYSLV